MNPFSSSYVNSVWKHPDVLAPKGLKGNFLLINEIIKENDLI